MQLDGFSALQIVAKAVFSQTGSLGPDPTASFSAIVNTPALGDFTGTTVNDYHNIMGIALKNFAAGDCDAINAQLDKLWSQLVELTKQLWQSVRQDPFQESRFSAPSDFDCSNLLSHLSVQLIICWGS
jgi:hypothetical protein